jgi:hypothetical protein
VPDSGESEASFAICSCIEGSIQWVNYYKRLQINLYSLVYLYPVVSSTSSVSRASRSTRLHLHNSTFKTGANMLCTSALRYLAMRQQTSLQQYSFLRSVLCLPYKANIFFIISSLITGMCLK